MAISNQQNNGDGDLEMTDVPLAETAPPEKVKKEEEEEEARRLQRKRWMWAVALLFVIALVVGLTVGLVFGLEDDEPTDGNTEELQQQCLDDLTALLAESDTLRNAWDAVLEATHIRCPDRRSQWQSCSIEDAPQSTVDAFLRACGDVGGQPHTQESQTFICHWSSTGGGMIGLEMDYPPSCVPSKCDVSASYFPEVVKELTILELEERAGLICSTETVDSTLDLIAACQDRYNPDGMICAVSEDMCAFFKVVNYSSCREYCEEVMGGDCLFMGGYKDDCEGRLEERSSCDSPVYDDMCTCTM